MSKEVKLDWKNHSKEVKSDKNERENYLKVIRGEQPDWVPVYRDACDWVFPGYLYEHIYQEKKIDMFGVEWEVDDYGEMAKPNRRLLDDITKWKEFVDLPDISKINWEKMAEEDLKEHDHNKALAYFAGAGCGALFIPLMNMLGFEDGLCALLEEPEAVADLFEAVTVINEETMRNLIPIYKPDVIIISDDLASAKSPFISIDIFNSLFRPYYQRMINIAKEFRIPVEFHMCGQAETLIRELYKMGINIWQPAQITNDLEAMKSEFGNSLVFNGGFDSQGMAGAYGATEEVVRQSVRDSIDKYAKGGGYIFWDLDPVGSDEDMLNKIAWLEDEARNYGSKYYKLK